MSKNDELQQKLVDKIKTKRHSVNKFGSELERSGVRLLNLSIICAAITTVLVAGPALGGEGHFIDPVKGALGLVEDSAVWQPLCFVAGLLSIAAAVALNMYKSHEIASRVAKAQVASAHLEGLETSVEFGQVSVEEGTKLYQQYIAEVPFIEEK